VNAEAGLLFSSGGIQFKASAQLKQSPNWAFFSNSTGTGAASVTGGFFDVGYSDARVTSVGGEMAISLPAELQLSSTVYIHDTELTNLGVQIPYHPRLSAQLGLSFPFASRRGIVQVTGKFVGERYADITETTTVDPFVDADVYARYDVRPNIGLVLRLQNLGINDHELWARYPQSPSIIMGGVRVLW
ncbi:MAG: TonB-dependent receptor, partial [Rhodothermales bacterium]|nr:TonB-dependent receptor [Rhodothermales bacterium]